MTPEQIAELNGVIADNPSEQTYAELRSRILERDAISRHADNCTSRWNELIATLCCADNVSHANYCRHCGQALRGRVVEVPAGFKFESVQL